MYSLFMDDYDRRHFIKTSIPGFLGISMALPAITAFAARANAFEGRLKADGAINWDAFLTAIEVEAKKHDSTHERFTLSVGPETKRSFTYKLRTYTGERIEAYSK